jgi:hypothetical protein
MFFLIFYYVFFFLFTCHLEKDQFCILILLMKFSE